jgi:hypothetical protein
MKPNHTLPLPSRADLLALARQRKAAAPVASAQSSRPVEYPLCLPWPLR